MLAYSTSQPLEKELLEVFSNEHALKSRNIKSIGTFMDLAAY
jgi:hypothetical protein